MPDEKLYRPRVKFLISNKAETATEKVNDFLDTLDIDNIVYFDIEPLIVPIGAPDRKAYLIGAMIKWWEPKESPVKKYDEGIDFGAGMGFDQGAE